MYPALRTDAKVIPLVSYTSPALISSSYFQDSHLLKVGNPKSSFNCYSHFLVPIIGIDALRDPETIHYPYNKYLRF